MESIYAQINPGFSISAAHDSTWSFLSREKKSFFYSLYDTFHQQLKAMANILAL